jgi:SHS2 domain-containing protein
MSKRILFTNTGTGHDVAFEEVEHTADRALRIYGSNMQELLFNAARAMNSLLVTDPEILSTREERFVSLKAADAESLLVDWLSELAFWAETETIVFHNFDIHVASTTEVKAILYGSRVSQMEKHIKAVTYHNLEIVKHNLEIVKTDKGLTATIVFDV